MALHANIHKGKKGKALTAADFYPYKDPKKLPKEAEDLTQKIVRINGNRSD